MKTKFSRILTSASALAMLTAAPVLAQDDDAGDDEDRIVVTGTLLRGVSPGASNVITLDREDIEATSVLTTTELLSYMPQFSGASQGGFGNFNAVNSSFARAISSNRLNIRGIGGSGIGGGGSTLIMMDGHRIPGGGVLQNVPDPDFVPAFAIQRVEVVTDGGSALYGSDAVGGVVNYITRRTFDGVEAGARYGFGDDYYQWDANIIAGTEWGSGGAYISYSYSEHDALFGRERDYNLDLNHNPDGAEDGMFSLEGVLADRNCAPPTVTIGSASYAVVGSGLGPIG